MKFRLNLPLVSVALAGILLTLVGSQRRSVVGDEFGSIWLAGQPSAAEMVKRVMATDVHPPTPYLLLHYWGGFFGFGDAPMRAQSLLWVLLCIPLISVLSAQFAPPLDPPRQRLAAALAASAPVLWVQAASARYYALAILAGLAATAAYLAWIENPTRLRQAGYAAATILVFYIHFLASALVVLAQIVHYALAARRTSAARPRAWVATQALIALGVAPIVALGVIPLLTGSSPSLGNAAPEGITGWRAFPLVLAGHAYATLTGGVPFPWDFWVTGPLILAVAGVALRGRRLLAGTRPLLLVVVPFVLLAAAVTWLLPVAGFFHGVFRAGHVPVLAWIVLGLMTAGIANNNLRRLAAAVLFACNAYSVIASDFNVASLAQTAPLKEMAARIRLDTLPTPRPLVFHPFQHGWGDALHRYLPEAECAMVHSRPGAPATIEADAALVADRQPATVWLIQRNRYRAWSNEMAGWLTQHGYSRVMSFDVQEQAAWTLRAKNALTRVRSLHFDRAPPQHFIWTLLLFDRVPPQPAISR